MVSKHPRRVLQPIAKASRLDRVKDGPGCPRLSAPRVVLGSRVGSNNLGTATLDLKAEKAVSHRLREGSPLASSQVRRARAPRHKALQSQAVVRKPRIRRSPATLEVDLATRRWVAPPDRRHPSHARANRHRARQTDLQQLPWSLQHRKASFE